MKLLTLFSTVVLITTATFVSKAQSPTIQTPEFKNKVQFVKKDNTLGDLELTELKTSMTNNMMGSGKMYLKAKGDHASVKRSGSPKSKFIVWLDAGIDPSTVVELFLFEKKTRKFIVGKNTMGSTKDVDVPTQRLTFSKVKDGVYTVSPANQLEPGEYIFTVNKPEIDFMSAAYNSVSMKGYAFYVEGADSE